MPSVLVVDDSPVDRCLVGGLLEKDAGLAVRYAVDGADAIAQMAETPFDLVVTDLVMPRVNGLELVEAIRRDHPRTPVVLVTSKGSEEVVLEALQKGAASYVPKRVLALRLLATVQNVLAVSHHEQIHQRLMKCLNSFEAGFALENDCALIRSLVTYLQDVISNMELCDEAEQTRVGVALEEALVNALYHGNLEIGSALREEDDSAYYALASKRCRQSPYRDRRIHVGVKLSRTEGIFVVRDEGSGFDPLALPDPTEPENLECLSGRGVLLMRTFMDEVRYNEVGNTVTLTKRRDSPVSADGNHEGSSDRP